jgi:hypothetical protein
MIGHLKTEGHLGRCYLKDRAGDAANVVLSRGSKLPPHPRMAERSLAHYLGSNHRCHHRPVSRQISFLTDGSLVLS